MRVYIFGNQDLAEDNLAFKTARKLQRHFKKVEFVMVAPNEDLPFANEKRVIVLDVIKGLEQVKFLHADALDKLILPPRTTTHDYDLGFQLKYLKKLGKLKKVRIIGIPAQGEIDYRRIHSIFKKLVAQDMQGS